MTARRLLAVIAVVLACLPAGTASGATFTVISGRSELPSAREPNRPGSLPLPADLMTPPAARPSIRYSDLLSLWRNAGKAYGVPWQVLAAINEIESAFGRDMGPSSANAIGWMQFLPSTWETWGVDADADGVADPWRPTDAVYAAARYLSASGAERDLAGAVFSYNHARWYVDDVLELASLYLADPFRGRALLGGRSGAGAPTNSRLERRLRSAQARVAVLEDQAAAIESKLDGSDERILAAGRAAGNPDLTVAEFDSAIDRSQILQDERSTLLDQAAQVATDLEAARRQVANLQRRLARAHPAHADRLVGGLHGKAAARVIDFAVSQLGVPYSWGGNHGASLEQMVATDPSPDGGFDCSSLIAWSFAKGAGIYVGDYTASQWELGASAPGATRGEGPAQGGDAPPGGYLPGDIIFFNDTDHVGLYVGKGRFVHAPHSGDVVRITSFDDYSSPVWGWVRYARVSGTESASRPADADDGETRTFTVVSVAGP